jgi:hypothetical protein
MHKLYLLENLKGRYLAEDLDVNGKITLKWILKKLGGRV